MLLVLLQILVLGLLILYRIIGEFELRSSFLLKNQEFVTAFFMNCKRRKRLRKKIIVIFTF